MYSKIYEIVTGELEKNNKEFMFSEQSYLYMSECSPDIINVPDIIKYSSNKEFLEIAYIAFLQRPIDEKAYQNWSQRFSLPSEQFRRDVIMTLVTSREFENTGVSVTNNIIYNIKETTDHTVPAGSAVKWPEKLLRFYRRQPEFIKKAVRKSMGMKG